MSLSWARQYALSWSKWKQMKIVNQRYLATYFSASAEAELTDDLKKNIELFWKEKVSTHHISKKNEGEKYYVLSMFPYPSGRLHMGHVRVYSISDAMARYKRLLGHNVIHPMGWDAFGLPAENAAIERGERPDLWTQDNIKSMKKQLEDLCCSFDWDRELTTCLPDYYKWTQFIFLKMFDAGLVYQKEGAVNWDPVDHTVLADEQIDENGCSWRSGAKVERRFLKQWYIRTTAYSKALYDGLDEVSPEGWKDIISLQRNWIGECNGTHLSFPVVRGQEKLKSTVSVFTCDLRKLEGASHILVSERHALNVPNLFKIPKVGTATESLLDVEAMDLINNRRIPVFVSMSPKISAYTETYIGIPAINEDDKVFANKYNLKYKENIEELPLEEITAKVKNVGLGGYASSEKARDWLISRQRYWGTPIPVIHCPLKGAVPVPYEDLPVALPVLDKLTGKGQSPLLQAEDWLRARCTGCTCAEGGSRETDTMDTFVDSSWYFLRYLDSRNADLPFEPSVVATQMPVDLYIGGKEHAIMHLYYARFFSHFLYEQGLVPTKEPFVNLLTQGMVMGQSFRLANTGRYVPPSQVKWQDGKPFEAETLELLTTDWEKMSKSKYNGTDPQDVIDTHGCDAMRLLILSGVAPKSNRLWKQEEFAGIKRWQSRMWSLVNDFMTLRAKVKGETEVNQEVLNEICTERNYNVKEIAFHMSKTFHVSVAISRLQSLTTALKKVPPVAMHSAEFERALGDLIIMLSPFAPMFASELWGRAASVVTNPKSAHKWDKYVLDQMWPMVDPDYHMNLVVRLNEKMLFEVKLPYPIGEEDKLNTESALQLAKTVPLYNVVIGNKHIDNCVYDYEVGYKATLDLKVKKKNLKNKAKNGN